MKKKRFTSSTFASLAKKIIKELKPIIRQSQKFTISVAGESGAGKTVLSYEIKNNLELEGIKCEVINQDAYFLFPPKKNLEKRKENISRVGVTEVQINIMEKNLRDFKAGTTHIVKPHINREEDRYERRILDVENTNLLIFEGTYTTRMVGIDCHIFLDLNFKQTKKGRIERNREQVDEFNEKVLSIENQLIKEQKARAHLIIKSDLSTITLQNNYKTVILE